MRAMKKIAAMMLVMMMMVSLAACGKKDDNKVVGTWELTKVVADGEEADLAEFEAQTGIKFKITFEFDKDGKVTGTMLGESVDGTYEVKGNNVDITFDDDTQTLKLDGDTLSIEEDGTEMVLTKQ